MPTRRKRPKRPQKQDLFAGLKRKLEQSPFRELQLVMGGGKEKMSDVLDDFIEPYVEDAESEDSYRKLLTLAILAWNVALLPEAKQPAMVEQLIGEGFSAAPRKVKRELRDFVNVLVARKKRFFSANRRFIIDSELTKTEEGYHLSVVSTLNKASGQ